MISLEAWTTIRYLHAQGKSIRQIAQELGLSRKTVRRALRSTEPPRYQRRPLENPQLAPFVDLIRQLAGEGLIGSRILAEIRARGYQGSPPAFYRLLARVRPTAPDPRVTERFETAPGQQSQFDWSDYTVELGGTLTRVVVYALILGYSRRLHYWASLDATQPSIFEALEAGFWHFGGVPQTVLIDNPRAFVLDPRPASFTWNPQFLALCGHYRVEPIACQPRRPRTKGKVERPFYFLEEHFIKGHSWRDFDRFCQELARFVAEVMDLREHHTTHQRPLDRFAEEAPHLLPLPATRYLGIHAQTRKTSWDCLVPYGGSRYSVPWLYAGKRVWLQTSQGVRLHLLASSGEVIATHRLSRTKGAILIDPAHYEGLRKDTPRTKVVLVDAFQARFPDQQPFLERLLAQQAINPVRHLRGILTLATLYPPAAMAAAFQTALTYNTYSVSFLRGVLQHQAQPLAPTPMSSGALRDVPRLAIKRDLRAYQTLLRPLQEVTVP
ncbi:MAG: IS21 family transposase [Armatimonadota bacterium]|nr:IS21 family transposase [Armatimonadota bacterium]